ncbi:alpha-(1,3)-fucosyltransferase B-like [Sycon ciliatum]|uniref:alpha-(1,3)-fucosyltransferase B-like n=1 Tax=Sycon ciliatum TaxID=27933 RepID=UPI0031F68A48
MVYTSNKSLFAIADAVEFPAANLPTMPTRANKYQIFMATSNEAPYTVERPERMADINLLRTFSSHADIPHSFMQPGECFCARFLKPLQVGFAQRKSVPVSALVSNCASHGKRQAVLKYLMANIEVHSMGSCLHNFKSNVSDPQLYLQQYLFNFAVENAICLNYITEKFQRPLILGTVPLVVSQSGLPDYDRVAPNRESYVDLAAFPSLLDAVSYIKNASQSESLYLLHHTYRGQPMNSEKLTKTFRLNVCSQNEDDLGKWCTLVRRWETPQGKEELVQKSYYNYAATVERECAKPGSMSTLVPDKYE